MAFLTIDDLAPFATIEPAKAEAMIADAEAMATLAAPCITQDGFTQTAAVKAILRAAVLRWNEAGSGALQSQTAGPFGMAVDTRQERRNLFWPSEITALEGICASTTPGSGAFSVDTAGAPSLAGHADICALFFGAQYCSCGYVLTAAVNAVYGA